MKATEIKKSQTQQNDKKHHFESERDHNTGQMKVNHSKTFSNVKIIESTSIMKSSEMIMPGQAMKKKEKVGYLSKYLDKMNEDQKLQRTRNSKSKTHKSKTNTGQYQMSTRSNKIHIDVSRDKKSVLGSHILNFQGQQQLNNKKQMKIFHIQADMPTKQFTKQSNYFDQSNNQEHLKSHMRGNMKQLNFDMGNVTLFQTANVKTYLFDRTLISNIKKE